jgi:uncharacterized protein (TIGR03382 family)
MSSLRAAAQKLVVVCLVAIAGSDASAQLLEEEEPDVVDTDEDDLPDTIEAFFGTDPTRADTDGDGVSDGVEVLVGRTDPLDVDTDGDGACDGPGLTPGTECEIGEDPNADGVVGFKETSAACADDGFPDTVGNLTGSGAVGCAATTGTPLGASLLGVLWLAMRRRRHP